MKQLTIDLDQLNVKEAPLSSILWPFGLGMAVNLVSLAIGDPYPMAVVGLIVALVATLAWSNSAFAWTLFVAVLAANPANNTTPIALNLFAAAVFFVLMRSGGWKVLPRLAQVALFFVMLSMVVSILASLSAVLTVPSIHTTDVSRPRPWMVTWTGGASLEILSSQIVSVTNYLLGPFLFIPLIFARIRRDYDPDLLLKGFVYALIIPTLALFLLARMFGRPVLDANALAENMLNVSTFRLWKLDIQMIRTQVGIILAALICASFAVAISPVRREIRIAGMGCLAIAAYLLLVTGSVGSTLAGLAGLVMILLLGKRQFSIKRYFTMLLVGVGLLVATWTILPQSIQHYAVSRYELRVGKSSSPTADRSWRWKKSFNYMMENPSGVGWSLFVEPLGIYPHNDYLTYGIAFGAVCGLVYLLNVCGMLFSFFSYNPGVMDPSRFAMALAGIGVCTVVLINSLSDHLTSNRWYFNVVWSLIWYAFFASRSAQVPSGSKTS
jgi:hypothetical protein